MTTHWQQGGYTTIKTETGQYTFKGISDEELKSHVADLDRRKNRIVRETTALMEYINGESESHPDAMR